MIRHQFDADLNFDWSIFFSLNVVYSFIHFNFIFPSFHSCMVIVIVMLRLLLSSFCSHSQKSFKIASHCVRGCVKVYLFYLNILAVYTKYWTNVVCILIVWFRILRLNHSNFSEKRSKLQRIYCSVGIWAQIGSFESMSLTFIH